MTGNYDFTGWATKNDIECADGRTIKQNAFAEQDGSRVPLVWNHNHDDPACVIGYADLENRPEGVLAHCSFNENKRARDAKELLRHGDIGSLSIYANKLKQSAKVPPCDVVHGVIREVSMVLAGANPGACIIPVLAHGDEDGECAEIYSGEENLLIHSDDKKEDEDMDEKEKNVQAENQNEEADIEAIVDSMTDEQKNALYTLVGLALEEGSGSDTEEAEDEPEEDEDETDDEETEEEKKPMRHNAFYGEDDNQATSLSHADQGIILDAAKRPGMTLKSAMTDFVEDNQLAHGAVNGFPDTADQLGTMFPDWHEVRGNSRYGELITDDNSWVEALMSKTQKVPFSRIRTSNVDLRELTDQENMLARGYKKGTQKKITGSVKVARRTTDPQTVYVKSTLNRDDVVDITDFDYVKFQYDIDQMALKETLGIATLFGDGREDSDADKIAPEHIRPIWTDDEIFTIHKDLDLAAAKAELQGSNTSANFGENYITAEAMVNALTYAMEDYRGTGTPDLFIHPHLLNVMILARDLNGRRIYSNVNELKTALGVNNIYKVQQMKNKVRKDDSAKSHECMAILLNPADYAYGATKGGDITHFTDFDIDFNQFKSLIETRKSGALTRIKSAIVIEKPVD